MVPRRHRDIRYRCDIRDAGLKVRLCKEASLGGRGSPFVNAPLKHSQLATG